MEKSPLKETMARALIRLGVSADFLTVLGLLFSLCSGWLIVRGDFFFAGIVLLSSGLLDLLDGAVARASGKASAFGGIFDSSLDRYGDAAVLGAAALYYGPYSPAAAFWALLALAGSFCVSYVRARAECEIDDCRTGFWERGERLVLLALALLLNNLPAALFFLAFGTQWTVFQRLAYARHATRGAFGKKTPFYLRTSPRSSWKYFFKVFLILAALSFWRPGA